MASMSLPASIKCWDESLKARTPKAGGMISSGRGAEAAIISKVLEHLFTKNNGEENASLNGNQAENKIEKLSQDSKFHPSLPATLLSASRSGAVKKRKGPGTLSDFYEIFSVVRHLSMAMFSVQTDSISLLVVK